MLETLILSTRTGEVVDLTYDSIQLYSKWENYSPSHGSRCSLLKDTEAYKSKYGLDLLETYQNMIRVKYSIYGIGDDYKNEKRYVETNV